MKKTHIILTTLLLAMILSVTIVNAKLRVQYVEEPIQGLVFWPGDVDFYECGEPHTIKVDITDCDYSVHVKIKQSGKVLFDGVLSEGQSSGWKNANQEETWVEVDHPSGMPLVIRYEGKICMYVS